MKDRFSKQSKQYASFRPTYPSALYQFLFEIVPGKNAVWDVGTGNGQVARDLCRNFNRVLATDISASQLENASPAKNIEYVVAGETINAPAQSFDLITVAQAIHWFNRPTFYTEVKRVGKPGGILAIWGYGLLRVNPSVDSKMDYYYKEVVGPYWDKERRLIDEHFASIDFPFEELKAPPFEFSFQWSLDELNGYMETWSAVQNYKQEKGVSPVNNFIRQLEPDWTGSMTVTFPLFMRVGKI
jgi:SAM-dependent methyltransferase